MSNVRSTEFQAILDAILSDKQPATFLPNIKQIEDPKEALKAIGTCLGKNYQPYSLMIEERHKTWYPKVFTRTGGMGSNFTGEGVVLTSDGKAYSFMMCEHFWDESGANHSRGWHPKRCRKCGFDASIDSGD